jgi:osmoprotectant transport system permease protein
MCRRALSAGDLDAYVDYAGTLWTNVIGRSESIPRTEMIAQISEWMRDNRGMIVLGSVGFENAYGFVMRSERAERAGIKTLENLARYAPSFAFGTDLEFPSRPEWQKVRETYNLAFKERSDAYVSGARRRECGRHIRIYW